MTKEERAARQIAQRLVNALAEVQTFFGDADLIFEEALWLEPAKIILSPGQLAEVRDQIQGMK